VAKVAAPRRARAERNQHRNTQPPATHAPEKFCRRKGNENRYALPMITGIRRRMKGSACP
jgi:hypothetical protein